MITYKVGFRFSLSPVLKTALDMAGWNAGKIANAVETRANIYLESAELVVPKAGSKAAEKEPIRLKGGKEGTVAIVGGVRYKMHGFPKALQRIVDFNDALREMVADFEVGEDIVLTSLPTWLQVELQNMEDGGKDRDQTLRK